MPVIKLEHLCGCPDLNQKHLAKASERAAEASMTHRQ